MKLDRSARAEQRSRGKDILHQEDVLSSKVFEIERDVRPSDWHRMKEQLENQWNEGRRFEMALDVGQLMLLGADDHSGLDMERWKRRSLVQAEEELKEAMPSLEIDMGISQKVVAWLLVDPRARESILTQLPAPQQLALWDKFEGLVQKSKIEQHPEVVVALFLLFPSERGRLRGAVSLDALTRHFQSDLVDGQQLWTRAYYSTLAICLLFPGNHEDVIPPGTVEQQRHLWGRDFLTIRAVATLYLLSADEVQVTSAGEVKVVRTGSKLKQPVDLPERNLV